MIRKTILTAALLLTIAAPASASEGSYRHGAPGLLDATTPPAELSLLKPGKSVTYAHGVEGWNCPRRSWFSDVQAYRWNGTALARQRNEIATHQRIRWGRVTFDGITFHNGYKHRSVLVAGWCAR